MSVTFTVIDPETNRPLELNICRRNGQLVLRELPAHLHLENASGRRLEAVAKFAQTSYDTYGRKGFVDGLPGSAAAIRAKLKRDGARSTPARDRRRAKLISLVPPEVLRQLKEVADLGGSVQIEEPVSAFYRPIKERSMTEILAEIPRA